jgi:hypothetical protein
MNEAARLKAAALCYWRYDRQFPLVALEASYCGTADVLAVSRARRLVETEVKISLRDLRADIKKEKHLWLREAYLAKNPVQVPLFEPSEWKKARRRVALWRLPQSYPVAQFYFAVPLDLVPQSQPVIADLYPYAGLLSVGTAWEQGAGVVEVVRKAYEFPRQKVPLSRLDRLVRDVSATVCRLALANYRLANNGKEVRDVQEV